MSRLSQILAQASGGFATVVPGVTGRRVVPVDLSHAAAGIDGVNMTDPDDLGRFIARQVSDAGGGVGAGGYGEERPIYASPLFRPSGEEPRTVHLGVDIWVPPGTVVIAPLNGRVDGLQDNDAPLDYGPTLILRHELAGTVFWTLYGHLARHTLFQLECGMEVPGGLPVAVVGDPSENGGWPPHLHFQIIGDMGEFDGDFPGVAPRSEADRWLDRCPDPNLILGIF